MFKRFLTLYFPNVSWNCTQRLRRFHWLPALSLTLLFLGTELFDEMIDTTGGAVLPLQRAELALTYAQIGLLLGLPHIIGTFVEPFIMLLGDTRLRKLLMLGGGIAIIASLLLTAGANSFGLLLAARVLFFPASGAFVSLSQATLMDLNPGREAQWMARWTVVGSAGNLLGPLLVAAGISLGMGWRWVFLALAGLVLVLWLGIWSRPFPPRPGGVPAGAPPDEHEDTSPRALLCNLWDTLRDRQMLRWLLLLEVANLMLDIFVGYAPLYFTDVVGVAPAQASLILTVLLATGLAADVLGVPVLDRLPGRQVVRFSAALALVVYTGFLLAPWLPVKIALLALIPFTTLGWYPVLQGEMYAAARGRSGTVMALASIAGVLGGGLAWSVGWIANLTNLGHAMWVLLLGPLLLVLLLPRSTQAE